MGCHEKKYIITCSLLIGILISFEGGTAVSTAKMRKLQKKIDDLSLQKQAIFTLVNIQKQKIYEQLKGLNDTMQAETSSTSWLEDSMIQKEYYLSRSFKKEFSNLMLLKQELAQMDLEEQKIIEEKNQLAINHQKHDDDNLRPQFIGFDRLKGKLPLPVNGPVVGTFGNFYDPQKSLFTFQKGITIKSVPGTSVQAVADGKVVYSGPLKNYGLIVIVEHPGQYYSLYGQLGGVSIYNGKMVKLKDVVGTTSQEPFYFEIRNKNVAVNPLQWFVNI